jgi:Asp-tRNA(Asn)/Glu-tRNA(Gln) amidotransferase A subunit family amidase
MAAGAATVHCERVKRHPDDYPPRITELVSEGLLISSQQLDYTDRVRRELVSAINESLGLDPLLIPATLDPAPTPETTGDAWCNSPWSFLGVPTVSIPLGSSTDGLPLAVQLVGGESREYSLLGRAAWLEYVFQEGNVTKPRGLPPVP